MNSVCMFMYASTTKEETQFYSYGAKVGEDLPLEAVNEFNALPICMNTTKHGYSVSGPSLVAVNRTRINDDDLQVIGDMYSISSNWLKLAVELLGAKDYTSDIMDYVAVCNKYNLSIVKILVPIKY